MQPVPAESQTSVLAAPNQCAQTPRKQARTHCASLPQLIEHPKGAAQVTVQLLPGAHVTAQSPPGQVNEQLSFDAQTQLSALLQSRST